MIYNIMLSLFLSISLAIGMQESTSITPNPQLLEKLKKILDEEKANKGTFIKKIMDDLKDCTDGKMVELNYLTLKSSYWWDQIPATMVDFVPKFTPEKFNDRKILSIDRKFQSSVYDREQPFIICSDEETVQLGEHNCKKRSFVNSWNSARDKIKFFTREDILETRGIKSHKIPDYLKGIVDYGVGINTKYDTYPSVFQMMKTLKTVKYKGKEACSKRRERL